MYRIRGGLAKVLLLILWYIVSQVLTTHGHVSGPSLMKHWNAYSVSVEGVSKNRTSKIE